MKKDHEKDMSHTALKDHTKVHYTLDIFAHKIELKDKNIYFDI